MWIQNHSCVMIRFPTLLLSNMRPGKHLLTLLILSLNPQCHTSLITSSNRINFTTYSSYIKNNIQIEYYNYFSKKITQTYHCPILHLYFPHLLPCTKRILLNNSYVSWREEQLLVVGEAFYNRGQKLPEILKAQIKMITTTKL